jgi:hypothetical protein
MSYAGESRSPSLTGPEADVDGTTGEAAPWLSWIGASDGDPDSLSTVLVWLERLEGELPEHADACRDEEVRLGALWRHMVPKLAQFLPEEISHVVSAQLDAAARRGAANALVDLVRAERRRLASANTLTPGVEENAASGVDAGTLRRLLEGIATDRASTGRAAVAEALETLCSIALELELTERRLGAGSSAIGETLTSLRDHVTEAAHTLRALPNNVQVRPQTDEQLEVAVRRCLGRYTGTLEARLDWSGGEPENRESASALLWVLQELLHHLHGSVAGWVTVTVEVQPSIQMTLTTPTASFHAGDVEPDWLLRGRLRLQLAGGWIRELPQENGSAVEVWLP